MWRALVAVLLVAGVVCVSVSQTPKAVSSYTLNSWQNQPGKTDQTDHKPVHEGNLMACTNVEPKKDGNNPFATTPEKLVVRGYRPFAHTCFREEIAELLKMGFHLRRAVH
jgi:hypothetical protein